jgi:uncharacterized protein (TIGR03437 family)
VLTSSPNPSAAGQAVVFAAMVTSPAALVPGSLVSFYDGGVLVKTVALVNGAASVTTADLGPGAHSITAIYGGDANFLGSTAAPLVQNVMAGLQVVSTASASLTVAPDSIASLYAGNFATTAVGALKGPSTPLGGVSVTVRDSAGSTQTALLFFVSPSQVNFLVPSAVAPGQATVTATTSEGKIVSGFATVAKVAPGFFSAAGDGKGVAAASATILHADGTLSYPPVFGCAAAGQCSAAAIPFADGDQAVLTFYGTGIRNAGGANAFSVLLGGVSAPVLFAGAQLQRAPGSMR